MGHMIPRYVRALPQFHHLPAFFSKEEMEQVSFLEDLQNFEKARVGRNSDPTEESLKTIRNSEISWLKYDQHNSWLFDKFSILTSHVNHDKFMLDIDGFDAFQYTIYNEDQFYTWHIDRTVEYAKFVRKISAVIMVSDPSEYDGGELEIVTDGNIEKPTSIKMGQGDVVYFASWMPHRVKPVTSGKRKTLVAWVMGQNND
jgi:PKHD-type hydroxylase